MRVAICSLSDFTYVAECLDVATRLATRHEVRYYLGYHQQPAVDLLDSRGLSYETVLGAPPALTMPAAAPSTIALFTEFFFAQAAAVLPGLLDRLSGWRPDVVLCHLRDYAGLNGAAALGIPAVSFGSHTNPVRREPDDPPFGAGLCRTAPEAHRRLLWQYDREFHIRLDEVYNRTLRQPYGLGPVRRSSSHVSDRLVLLSMIPALGNTNSPLPTHVRFVGSLFSKPRGGAGERERRLLARLEESPRPRVFVTLGATYGPSLLRDCLAALAGVGGTVVASGLDRHDDASPVIGAPFISDVDAVLRACDAVVSVCGGKTVMDALAHGLPVVGLPRQGEQREIALALHEHGAALLPCRRRWDAARVRAAVFEACREGSYRDAATGLRAQVVSSGGAAAAVEEVVRVLSH